MQFYIKQGQQVLATIRANGEDPEAIFLEREDGELLLGLELGRLGDVQVGHWPEDDGWVDALFIPSTYKKDGEYA